ncbi:MAG: M20/M25/M40 family metallo-hydrolase [Bacteroidales bacterium]|nr:M20/M25/M40 family metallo-hydrolase [Bacteroidales bacterium]
MKNINLLFIVLIITFLYSCNPYRIDNPAITGDELEDHINYLASDALEGRLPGTKGDSMSASYIKDNLEGWGLKPLSGNVIQEFEIVKTVKAGDDNRLMINNKQVDRDKFMPMAFSEDTTVSGEIVFAGYGFSISSDTLRWNDYKNLEVSNKWVMLLRADPEVDDQSSKFAQVSNDRNKAMLAKDMGAAGVLLVSGYNFDPEDKFEKLAGGEYSTGIPVFRINREVADMILSHKETTIREAEENLNSTYSPLSFDIPLTVEGQSDIYEEKVTTGNVAMVLQGNDPVLKNEYIIIGGHFDHLGMGGQGTSSRAPDTTAVHYGADDNASGIAAMLEIAEKFAGEESNSRSIIFAGFAAEEMGLLGSKYFADNMTIETGRINAMINLDMIGRLKDNNTMQVSGTGTAETLEEIIKSHNDTSVLRLALSEEGYGPSDHSSFYGKDIPVLFFSTGAHLDYHTPFDTPGKINYEGLLRVTDFIYDISSELANQDSMLVFTEAGPKTRMNRRMRRKGVTLGIMPDFAGNVKNGLRADFVIPGRPAENGGMKKGDIITAINGKEINNIEDYMYRLSKLEHGQTIQVEILRGEDEELLLIAL